MIDKLSQRLHGRSAALLMTLEQRLSHIFLGWMMVMALACAAHLASSPGPIRDSAGATVWTYALLIAAPIASALLALRWFADGNHVQPAVRLARIGHWRAVGESEARRHPLYGTSGIMVSLLIGMLLNIPFRTFEFLLAIPPITAAAPGWVQTLQTAMVVDAVLFSSLYAIAFVTALRRVPLFPRLLALVWLADVAMQLVIAGLLGAEPGLPPVAAGALKQLLEAAVLKVLISVVLWTPYLLLSKRVNVTYRWRLPI